MGATSTCPFTDTAAYTPPVTTTATTPGAPAPVCCFPFRKPPNINDRINNTTRKAST